MMRTIVSSPDSSYSLNRVFGLVLDRAAENYQKDAARRRPRGITPWEHVLTTRRERRVSETLFTLAMTSEAVIPVR
jgi:hypothetical protein